MMGLSFVGTSLAMKYVMASIDPNKDTKQKVPFTTHCLQQQSAYVPMCSHRDVFGSLLRFPPDNASLPGEEAESRAAEEAGAQHNTGGSREQHRALCREPGSHRYDAGRHRRSR